MITSCKVDAKAVTQLESNGNKTLTIAGLKNNDTHKSITLVLENFNGAGTYNITTNNNDNQLNIYFPDNIYTTAGLTDVTIEITEDGNYLKGTLTGEIADQNQNIYTIYDGKFYVKKP